MYTRVRCAVCWVRMWVRAYVRACVRVCVLVDVLRVGAVAHNAKQLIFASKSLALKVPEQ